MKQYQYLMLCLIFIPIYATQAEPVRIGLDCVPEYAQLFEGKRLGLIANQTAVNRAGQGIAEVFFALPDTQVTALFAPEHGLWGSEAAGADVNTVMHPDYHIPVYSLYKQDGLMAKPTSDMLAHIDVLVFDIQDIGTRFYTYIWTLALVMEAAAEHDIEIVVLDRPNPVAGLAVQGPILESAFASFKGLYPISVVHNMTVGELARLFNGQGWLNNRIHANLTVIPVQGWHHAMPFEQTGLSFIAPSPNMRSLDTARVYPGLALLEGTNVSEGRGTDLPFLQFGAPWLDAKRLCSTLSALDLPGVRFSVTQFTPASSKHQDKLCQGIRLHITDPNKLTPFMLGVHIVQEIALLHETDLQWRTQHFDELCGTDRIRKAIQARQAIDPREWDTQLQAFKRIRQTYLLYPCP